MKKWIKSKTLWINLIGIAAIILQCEYGFVMKPEYEGLILTAINIILRAITNEGLER